MLNKKNRKSSIHIEAGHIGEFFHNSREKETSNSIFKQDNNFCSCNAKEALEFYNKELQQRAELYTKRTGQKLQKKSITLLSAIVNLKQNTTKEEFQAVCDLLEEKLDTKVVQSAVHLDEGHFDENEEKINYHGHIMFLGLDSEGKSVRKKLDRKMLKELQTEVAKTLKMERGDPERKAKRLDTYEYKQHAKLQAQKTQELQQKIKELEAKNVELKQENVELKKENQELKISVKDLKAEISSIRKKMIEHNKEHEEFTKDDYKALAELKKELNASNISEIKQKLDVYEQMIRNRVRKQISHEIEANSNKGMFKTTISTQTALSIVNNVCNVNDTKKVKEIYSELREKRELAYKVNELEFNLNIAQQNLRLARENADNKGFYDVLEQNKQLQEQLEKQKEITHEKEYLIQELQKQITELEKDKEIKVDYSIKGIE